MVCCGLVTFVKADMDDLTRYAPPGLGGTWKRDSNSASGAAPSWTILPIGLLNVGAIQASLGGGAMSTLLVLVVFAAVIIAIWIVVIWVGGRKDRRREFAAAAIRSAGATLLVWPKYEQERPGLVTGRSVGIVEILATAGAALLIRRREALGRAVPSPEASPEAFS
jgi:hypothetical protein